jgi:hypothetical protein
LGPLEGRISGFSDMLKEKPQVRGLRLFEAESEVPSGRTLLDFLGAKPRFREKLQTGEADGRRWFRPQAEPINVFWPVLGKWE